MTTPGQADVRRFLGGVLRRTDKRLVRQVVFLVSQGRWERLVELARVLGFPRPLAVADLKAVIDPLHTMTDAVVFRNRLTADPALRRRLAALADGDWAGARALAEGEGLAVVAEDLRAILADPEFRAAAVRVDAAG